MADRPRSVERVRQALAGLGVETEVVELDRSSRTAQLAADALGVSLGSIAKSLVLMADGTPLLALVAGDRRADLAKIASAVGAQEARLATADEVRELTGYAVGGVPPIGHDADLPVLMDLSLFRFELLHAAAGSPHAVFPISVTDLERITGARRCDIVED